MKIGFLYAGQGAHYVGMGKDFYEAYPVFKETFDKNSDVVDVKKICFDGPDEELNLTANTQPCMVAFAVGVTKVLAEMGIKPDMAMVDGNRLPVLDCPAQCVIKGDATSASIAAASVLAKVSRDRYMRDIAEKYPQYGFEQHKGYGTALHCEMLRKYGPSEVHRRTFLKKILGE